MNVKGMVTSVILVIIAIIVIFQIVGNTSTDLTNAAGNISGSGLPLASLFQSNGVVLLIFMAGILLAIVGIALKMHKGN
jgi:hypothetical protein